MKKELIKVFKKFKHSVRLFLESSDKLNDLYLNSKKNKLEKLYCNEEVDNKKIVFNDNSIEVIKVEEYPTGIFIETCLRD